MSRKVKVTIGLLVAAVTIEASAIGFLSYRLFLADREKRTAADVTRRARGFAEKLTTYSHATVEQDIREVLDLSTPRFEREYREVLAGETFRKALAEAKGSSRGAVQSVHVTSIEGSRAIALVRLDQTIVNESQKTPRTEKRMLEITMQRSDERWLIDRVEIIE